MKPWRAVPTLHLDRESAKGFRAESWLLKAVFILDAPAATAVDVALVQAAKIPVALGATAGRNAPIFPGP
jgi:hypothetical protein